MNHPTCKIDGCDRPRKYVSNGLCGMHYKRLRKYGSYNIPDDEIPPLDMPEKWRAIAGYEALYEVSDQGRVKSVARTTRHGNHVRSKLIALVPTSKGYLKACLCRDGVEETRTVHRMVLEAFIGSAPAETETCHNNGDQIDNRLANLRWDTHSENVLDIGRHGRNHELNKTRCPRGHELERPNLYTKQGKRICLACKREHTAAYNEGREFDPVKADERYRQIMESIAA